MLVAGPDSHVRGLIAGALIAEGCRTRAASTADEVRSCIAADRDPIDLVVVDARILDPDLANATSPVVVIGRPATALDPEGRVELHVLDEPLSLADLVRTVTSLLRPVDSLVPS